MRPTLLRPDLRDGGSTANSTLIGAGEAEADGLGARMAQKVVLSDDALSRAMAGVSLAAMPFLTVHLYFYGTRCTAGCSAASAGCSTSAAS